MWISGFCIDSGIYWVLVVVLYWVLMRHFIASYCALMHEFIVVEVIRVVI